MKNKRALALILFASIASGLTACGSSEQTVDTTQAVDTTTDAPVETSILDTLSADELSALGLDGYEFTIYMRQEGYDWSNPDIHTEEANGEVFNDAIYSRNLKLEEKYGFTIKPHYSPNTSGQDVSTFILAGDDYIDLAFPGSQAAASLAQTGCFMDISMLDYVDLGADCWNKTFNDELNIGGRQFYVTGDISVNAFMATRAMMFNKTLLEKYRLESPYELVRAGKWTLDKLAEMAALASADINGDSLMDTKDQWGMVMQSANAGMPMFYGAGLQAVEIVDGLPEIALTSSYASDVFDKIVATLARTDVFYKGADDDVNNMFSVGRALFHAETIRIVQVLRTSDVEFGVLPAPKFDEEQDFYRAYADSWCISPACVPVTASDTERSGFVLQALSEYSSTTTRPAYYDIVLTGKSLRDDESAEMLDIIFDSFTLDNCDIYQWSGLLGPIKSSFKGTTSENLATILAANSTAVKAAIDKTVEAFKKIA